MIPKDCKRFALDWNEVTKVLDDHLSANAMMKPLQVREGSPPYAGKHS